MAQDEGGGKLRRNVLIPVEEDDLVPAVVRVPAQRPEIEGLSERGERRNAAVPGNRLGQRNPRPARPDRGAHRHPQEIGERRDDIHEANEPGNPPAPRRAGDAHQQGHVHDFVEERDSVLQVAVFQKLLAVVRRQHDQCARADFRIETVEQTSELGVGVGDLFGVEAPPLRDRRRIRQRNLSQEGVVRVARPGLGEALMARRRAVRVVRVHQMEVEEEPLVSVRAEPRDRLRDGLLRGGKDTGLRWRTPEGVEAAPVAQVVLHQGAGHEGGRAEIGLQDLRERGRGFGDAQRADGA